MTKQLTLSLAFFFFSYKKSEGSFVEFELRPPNGPSIKKPIPESSHSTLDVVVFGLVFDPENDL